MSSKFQACGYICLAALILLTSCMGTDTKVKISQDGTGLVAAEYRLSEELVAFGELEENKAMLPVPLSRADVENSLRSAPGLRLESWSSRKDGTDLVVKTVIAFDNLESLMYYLDPKGELARHSFEADTHSINFSLGDKIPAIDPDMKEIAKEAFAPYRFSFVVELPKPPKQAASQHPAIVARVEGNTVYFEGSMQDLVTSETAPAMSLSW